MIITFCFEPFLVFGLKIALIIILAGCFCHWAERKLFKDWGDQYDEYIRDLDEREEWR